MKKIIVLVGIPGSGKSTVAKELSIAHQAKVFSSDDYRARILGSEGSQVNNELVFKTLYRELREHLLGGQNVIFDATNTTMRTRTRFFENIWGIECEKIAYVVPCDVETCIKRDLNRNRVVGKEVIHKFASSYQFPQKFEGFGDIVIHGHDAKNPPHFNEELCLSWHTKLRNHNQNNPHHLYTVGDHCDRVAELLKDCSRPMYLAAKIHDVGKPSTETVRDGISHYYSHANYGTVMLLCALEVLDVKTWDEIYEILFYVNYHMLAHDLKTEKSQNKYREIFGEKLFKNLILFGEADRIGSGTHAKNECESKEGGEV